MKHYVIEITTNEKMMDITEMIREYIRDTQLKEGCVQVQVTEPTAGLTISVNNDWRLEKEFFKKINHLLPKYDGMMFTGWTTSNVKASLIGLSLQLLVAQGTLILDKNQSVYFIEFNGPGERNFFVNSVGSKFEDGEKPQMPEALKKINQKRIEGEEEILRIQEEMRNEWRQKEEEKKKED
ncbi:MAG: secondary thiamine-phosphate synthase enzyme YjbQ [Eubacteriaceae bacterium]